MDTLKSTHYMTLHWRFPRCTKKRYLTSTHLHVKASRIHGKSKLRKLSQVYCTHSATRVHPLMMPLRIRHSVLIISIHILHTVLLSHCCLHTLLFKTRSVPAVERTFEGNLLGEDLFSRTQVPRIPALLPVLRSFPNEISVLAPNLAFTTHNI